MEKLSLCVPTPEQIRAYLSADWWNWPQLEETTRRAVDALCEGVVPRGGYRRLEHQQLQPLCVGKDIQRHLQHCDQGVLLWATLGAEVDFLLRKAAVLDTVYSIVLDATACAMAELLIEQVQDGQKEYYQKQGRFITGRFSPGYGDWPLEMHRYFAPFMGRDGITVTAQYLLLPTKSITALCGVSDRPVTGYLAGCDTCALRQDCNKRKEGVPCGANK